MSPSRCRVAGFALLAAGIVAPAAAGSADGSTARAKAAAPVEINVYAAASLKDVLLAIAPGCEAEAGARLLFNFGASNALARQIVAAHKADLFLSADRAQMEIVLREGLIDDGWPRALLSNRLAVVVPDDTGAAIRSAADLAGPAVARLALADPKAVPAGRYAKAWLEKTGLWEALADRVVPFPDVRAALAAVESGAADAGIVYRTDAAIARRVRVAFEIGGPEGPDIVYPLAVLRDRPSLETARRVAACFAGPAAGRVFERFGFLVLGSSS